MHAVAGQCNRSVGEYMHCFVLPRLWQCVCKVQVVHDHQEMFFAISDARRFVQPTPDGVSWALCFTAHAPLSPLYHPRIHGAAPHDQRYQSSCRLHNCMLHTLGWLSVGPSFWRNGICSVP